MTGKIHNREDFLETIARSLGRKRQPTVQKPEWSRQPQWNVFKDKSKDELVEVLKKQCDRIHTQVWETSADQLKEVLQNVIDEFGGESVVTWDDPRFEQYALTDFMERELPHQQVAVHQWNPSIGEDNLKIAERANIGITFSDVTLAESGTVTLFSDEGKGRSVSLLPAAYIAIIPKETIVPRITQVPQEVNRLTEEGRTVPSCVNFISGPSNSADIEMNLIVGVHGPVRAGYIIVD